MVGKVLWDLDTGVRWDITLTAVFFLLGKKEKKWFMRSRYQMVLKLELQYSKKDVSVTIIHE